LAVVAVLLAAPVLPAAASGDSISAQLHRLRVCESSDDYRTNTGNVYYGAYQFDMQTWRGLDQRAARTEPTLHAGSGRHQAARQRLAGHRVPARSS